MNYSFSTVFITILISNLFLLLLTIMLRSKKILINIGYKLLAVFMGLTLMRLLFPFEFPFSTNIYFPKLLSRLVSYLRHPGFIFFGWDLSIWNFFEFVWIIGILAGILHYLWKWNSFRCVILANGIDVSGKKEYTILLDRICKEKKRINKFLVYEIPCLTGPMICSIGKPCILMPSSMHVTPDDLYYILCHETAHYFHRDLLTKLLIHMVCILYWWNPACWFLKKQADIVFELRVDQEITSNKSSQKVAYLQCLIRVAKEHAYSGTYQSAISFCSRDNSSIILRYQYLLDGQESKRSHLLNFVLLILMIGLYLSSYFIIFEAYYMPPEISQVVDVPTIENTYLIDNGDGTYDVFLDGEFIETTESLEYYPNNLIIIERSQVN